MLTIITNNYKPITAENFNSFKEIADFLKKNGFPTNQATASYVKSCCGKKSLINGDATIYAYGSRLVATIKVA